MKKIPSLSILTNFIVFCIIVSIYTLLIMVIWNKVLIKKFPLAQIQTLRFWEALAIGILGSLLTGTQFRYSISA